MSTWQKLLAGAFALSGVLLINHLKSKHKESIEIQKLTKDLGEPERNDSFELLSLAFFKSFQVECIKSARAKTITPGLIAKRRELLKEGNHEEYKKLVLDTYKREQLVLKEICEAAASQIKITK